MTTTDPSRSPAATLDPGAVAEFLRENPDFFTEHAAVFAELRVPHPYEGRAISLGERQLLGLRERLRTLEQHLASLTHNARDNERIVLSLRDWSLALLAESDPHALPGLVREGLARAFDIPYSALRLWDCPACPEPPDEPVVPDEVRLFVAGMAQPYCGPDHSLAPAGWLAATPASLAMIPVRTPRGQTFGLLVLGSDDEQRFALDMRTDFLQHIGALSGAALSRLRCPA